jgi:hypothetical protein
MQYAQESSKSRTALAELKKLNIHEILINAIANFIKILKKRSFLRMQYMH